MRLSQKIKEFDMNDSTSPLSPLDLPGRLQKLIEKGGITTIDELTARLEEDPKSILAIGGIGPKTLLDISSALDNYKSEITEPYPEPVQSLGDQFKSLPHDESMSVSENIENQEKVKKEKKKKEKKSKKADQKESGKSKKTEKNKSSKKKGKKSKKSKGKKTKKNKKK